MEFWDFGDYLLSVEFIRCACDYFLSTDLILNKIEIENNCGPRHLIGATFSYLIKRDLTYARLFHTRFCRKIARLVRLLVRATFSTIKVCIFGINA